MFVESIKHFIKEAVKVRTLNYSVIRTLEWLKNVTYFIYFVYFQHIGTSDFKYKELVIP